MITGCISASCNCMIIGAFFFLAWLGVWEALYF